jgi:uncharacterized protein YbbC (DUF1343 family)
MKFGIDRLLLDRAVRKPLDGRRVALLAHPRPSLPISRTRWMRSRHMRTSGLPPRLGRSTGCAATSRTTWSRPADDTDPTYKIPVFSLYGKVRRPTDAMMETFDVLLVDLQDLGTRVYTFLTTLRYVLEAAERHGKAVWVLDRRTRSAARSRAFS